MKMQHIFVQYDSHERFTPEIIVSWIGSSLNQSCLVPGVRTDAGVRHFICAYFPFIRLPCWWPWSAPGWPCHIWWVHFVCSHPTHSSRPDWKPWLIDLHLWPLLGNNIRVFQVIEYFQPLIFVWFIYCLLKVTECAICGRLRSNLSLLVLRLR